VEATHTDTDHEWPFVSSTISHPVQSGT